MTLRTTWPMADREDMAEMAKQVRQARRHLKTLQSVLELASQGYANPDLDGAVKRAAEAAMKAQMTTAQAAGLITWLLATWQDDDPPEAEAFTVDFSR